MAIKRLKYAGIGPRQCPAEVCEIMAGVAHQMDQQGWIVRSGHAQGADQAWASGHEPERQEIYLPWAAFNSLNGGTHKHHLISPDNPQIEAVARLAHPAWNKLSLGARKLMQRNVSIILGPELDDPVEFVAYWYPDRKLDGGTANAVNLAQKQGIPCFNIHFEEDQQAMSNFVDSYHQQSAD